MKYFHVITCEGEAVLDGLSLENIRYSGSKIGLLVFPPYRVVGVHLKWGSFVVRLQCKWNCK